WTEVLLNVLGFYMDQDPSPIMMLLPTLEIAEGFSKERLATMLRVTKRLHRAIKPQASKDGANTLLTKSFPGGYLVLAGANSAASLSSRPIRVLLADEVDRYPTSAGEEGDPLLLAQKRTNNFWNRRRLAGGTPTVAGRSRTEKLYEGSDQREYRVPCPHCGEFQTLEW